MTRLVIAEKPSVARAICPVVGAATKKNGYFEGNGYIVSWCFGHLVQLKYPDNYCEEWAAKPWTFDARPMPTVRESAFSGMCTTSSAAISLS